MKSTRRKQCRETWNASLITLMKKRRNSIGLCSRPSVCSIISEFHKRDEENENEKRKKKKRNDEQMQEEGERSSDIGGSNGKKTDSSSAAVIQQTTMFSTSNSHSEPFFGRFDGRERENKKKTRETNVTRSEISFTYSRERATNRDGFPSTTGRNNGFNIGEKLSFHRDSCLLGYVSQLSSRCYSVCQIE